MVPSVSLKDMVSGSNELSWNNGFLDKWYYLQILDHEGEKVYRMTKYRFMWMEVFKVREVEDDRNWTS